MLRATIVATVVVTCSLCGRVAAEEDELTALLGRMADVAKHYRAQALKFTCEERISWFSPSDSGSERFGYVFVFGAGEGFTEYRTRLRRKQGKKPPRRVTPEEYNVKAYLDSPYLWIFTFRSERQDRHVYRLVGEETVLDRPAVMVRFEPVPPIEANVNNWFGTAWVDRETAQLLKVETYTPGDHKKLRSLLKHLEGEAVTGMVYTVERITTEFSVVARGMRFPGKVELRRERYDVSKGTRRGRVLPGVAQEWTYDKTPVLQVDQTYRNYRFFGVDSEEHLIESVP